MPAFFYGRISPPKRSVAAAPFSEPGELVPVPGYRHWSKRYHSGALVYASRFSLMVSPVDTRCAFQSGYMATLWDCSLFEGIRWNLLNRA